MKKMCMLWLSCLALSAPTFGQSAESTFSHASAETRYRQLISELRCVVCQNEDLADSTVPLAAELRQQIALKVQQQQSDQDIKAYLSQRYGEFILFKPSFSPKNYLLWLGPFLLTLAGVCWLLQFLSKRSKPASTKPLSIEERQRLNELLKP